MAAYIGATPQELREVAKSLRQCIDVIKDATHSFSVDWVGLDMAYHDPDSQEIGYNCKAIIDKILKLEPHVEDAASLFEGYADWLEGGRA